MALDFLKKKTQVFDSSKHKVLVANLPIDGLIGADYSPSQTVTFTQGVHSLYSMVNNKYDGASAASITVMPTAKCVKKLKLLFDNFFQNGDFFKIVMYKNDELVLDAYAWPDKLPTVTLDKDGNDITFSFGVLKPRSPVLSEFFDDIPLDEAGGLVAV